MQRTQKAAPLICGVEPVEKAKKSLFLACNWLNLLCVIF